MSSYHQAYERILPLIGFLRFFLTLRKLVHIASPTSLYTTTFLRSPAFISTPFLLIELTRINTSCKIFKILSYYSVITVGIDVCIGDFAPTQWQILRGQRSFF